MQQIMSQEFHDPRGNQIIEMIEECGISEAIDYLVGYCQAQSENATDSGMNAMEAFSWQQIAKDLLKARLRAKACGK